MKNTKLGEDYLKRARIRLSAIDALFAQEGWADVVRECQEAVELGLKGALRLCNIEVPRIHDVGEILKSEQARLPTGLKTHLPRIAKISHDLRRDLELAFYGSEDLTPSEFYKKADATEARDNARWVIELLFKIIVKKP